MLKDTLRHFLFIGALCLLPLSLIGCGSSTNYLGFWKKQRALKTEFKEEPSADVLRELRPEDAYLLVGRVSLNKDHKGPILVVAVTDKFKEKEIVAARILQDPVHFYQVYLPEGAYDLYFFADLDGNRLFDASEMVGQTSGRAISVTSTAITNGLTCQGPSLSLDVNHPTNSDLAISVAVKDLPYVFESLDDEFFDPKYGGMGLYNPKEFIAHTQRYFFALEKLDPNKTLVVFVHGVGGTPRDFKYLVEGLDKKHYQPWFFYYMSGMPLQKLGSLLADVLSLGNTTKAFHYSRLIVVAHSMGGLVALSGLNELCANSAPPYLKGYISFDSPYGGVVDAKKGVESAPAVVPSWRDVATGSDFLERLYQGKAIGYVPFYLFFGYETGKSSDGTITLQSQLDPRVHFNAFKSYGFNATHVGILNNEQARQKFLKTLDVLDGKSSEAGGR
jgi:pimeloyl-ACP methyl ester carboxylesterase